MDRSISAVFAFPATSSAARSPRRSRDLVEAGTIRIIDLAFVGKNPDGDVVAFELTDIDPEVRAGLENLGVEVNGLLNEDDIRTAAEALEPNSSAALLVWENVWARQVKQAIMNAGGELLEFQRIPHEVVKAAREWALANARRRERGATEMFGRRGPGLVRAAATTAVVAGTAGAVRHRQDQKYAAQDQAAYDQQIRCPAGCDATAGTRCAGGARLHGRARAACAAQSSGECEEEFEAKKKQRLGI